MFASSKTGSMMAGVGIGAAAGMAGSKMMTKSGRRACRRNAAKCMKTVEDMIDGVSSMMK